VSVRPTTTWTLFGKNVQNLPYIVAHGKAHQWHSWLIAHLLGSTNCHMTHLSTTAHPCAMTHLYTVTHLCAMTHLYMVAHLLWSI